MEPESSAFKWDKVITLYNNFKSSVEKPLPDVVEVKPDPLPPAQLVIWGTVNSGKSSLGNALLGSDILPESTKVCTSKITVLKASRDDKFRVIRSGVEQVFNEKDEIVEYLDESVGDKEDTNLTEVVVVEWVGSVLLNQGLEIVDTPGYNENKELKEKSIELMKSAAVVLFLIDRNDGCLNDGNMEVLTELSKAGILPLIVLNKADSVPPRECKKPKQKKEYFDATKQIISESKEKIKKLFPGMIDEHFFPLSAFEAKEAKENQLPLPEPFQKFLGRLGSAFYWSLVRLSKNKTEGFFNHVTTMMKEVATEDRIRGGLLLIEKLIQETTRQRKTMIEELSIELETSYRQYVTKNEAKLTFDVYELYLPLFDTPDGKSQLFPPIYGALSDTLLNHYAKWHENFFQQLSPLIEEGITFWNPDLLKKSFYVGEHKLTLSATDKIKFWGSGILYLCVELLSFPFLSIKFVREELQNFYRYPWPNTILLNSESLKHQILDPIIDNSNEETRKMIQILENNKKTLQDKLNPDIRNNIQKHLHQIVKSYVEILSTQTTFEHGIPSINYDSVVSFGNSWGLIYEASLDGNPFFAQVIEQDVVLNYKYLDVLSKYMIFDMGDGKKAILREKCWGKELRMSLEGIQSTLNNFLIDFPQVTEDVLRESLTKCFISKGYLPNDAESQINMILLQTKDFVKFEIDLRKLIPDKCRNGTEPSILELMAVNAYTMETDLYRYINQELRSPERTPSSLENWKPFLCLFLKALKSMKPVTTGVVYRGLDCVIKDYKTKLSPDREAIYFYTITSASDDRDVAIEFATRKGKGMVFEISLTYAYSIDWLSRMSNESERIFPPGSCFKVTSITEEKNYVFVRLQQQPSAAYFL
eukprot:TRINITY_DN9499_c0_g1_i1.p1 TRINITY_DN9499_c0_g1~~TRINITY_DN9499_c0_g1_i1.p1  ORF type:complete len:873 (+),score=157.73 TRINITY_DN9499_c0_g1_i1:1-2619(+)